MLLEALFRRTDATSDSEVDIIRQEMEKENAPDKMLTGVGERLKGVILRYPCESRCGTEGILWPMRSHGSRQKSPL